MKWPCVFSTTFHKEQVNERLYRTDPKAPIGAFTKAWRTEHCATINPYGSESCPYAPEDCSLAFLMVGLEALDATKSRIGLFRAIARRRGLDRAESKPLTRERYDRTDGQQSRSTGLRDGPGAGPGDVLGPLREQVRRPATGTDRVPGRRSVDLRRADHRLQSMGDLLRGDGAGSRTQPYRRHESETSADHDGDARDPVPPPPPRRLGDQPSSGDPDLHQGGE